MLLQCRFPVDPSLLMGVTFVPTFSLVFFGNDLSVWSCRGIAKLELQSQLFSMAEVWDCTRYCV